MRNQIVVNMTKLFSKHVIPSTSCQTTTITTPVTCESQYKKKKLLE